MSHRDTFLDQIFDKCREIQQPHPWVNLSAFNRAVLETIADRLHEQDLRLRVLEQGTRHLMATPEGNEYRNFMLNKMAELGRDKGDE